MTTAPLDLTKLEPLPTIKTDDVRDVANLMAYSQAVSLKRIAAALETIAQHLAQPGKPAELLFPATPVPDADGWIAWHGNGEPPLRQDQRIEYRMRDGEIGRSLPRYLDWSWSGTTAGETGSWEITAYRVVQP